ncbi:MAG: hypothetical protein K2G11_08490, partial [Muribaculaceae bacterium]|nr:hypothetical protein [Muribaculaceae bacterium]
MGKFIDYLFNNRHYKEVKQAYELVHSASLQCAFDLWQRHLGLTLSDSYEDMEYILAHMSDVKMVDHWIQITHRLKTNQRKGIEWLYSVKRGMSTIPVMDYKEYKFVATNESNIKTYDRYYITYNRILSSNREAVQWLYYDTFGVQEIPACSYKEIEFIATNESKIKQFQHILNEYNSF